MKKQYTVTFITPTTFTLNDLYSIINRGMEDYAISTGNPNDYRKLKIEEIVTETEDPFTPVKFTESYVIDFDTIEDVKK